jgi:stage III sporulation protein AB
MIIRVIGSGLVIGSAVWVGRAMAEPYRQRVRALAEWVGFLERLKVELTFRQRPLVDALHTAAVTDALKTVAGRFRAVLAEFGSLEQASEQAFAVDSRLGNEERAVLVALVPPLATAPAPRQSETLDHGIDEITRILKAVRDDSNKKARLIETLSTLAGLTAVLMLL